MEKIFSLTVRCFCLSFVFLAVGAVTMQYSEARDKHVNETGSGTSDLLPDMGSDYYARTFKDVEQCKVINREIEVNGLKRHSEFRMSCEDIWYKALLIDAVGDQMQLLGGFSVISVFGKERYYPVITTIDGELSYPGGFAASYDYTVLTNDEARMLNYGLSVYGIN